MHVNFFEAAFASWVGAPPLMCIFDETCGNALALEYNGDLYSCDHFVEPDYLVGNIMSESIGRLAASERQRLFGEAKRDALPACCRDCDVLFACRGECPKNRFRASADGEPGLNYLCEGYKTFFLGIEEPMRLMARLYQAGDSPAQIMDIIEESEKERERTFARAGRNDPCPCGSGKKFKACHGAEGERK